MNYLLLKAQRLAATKTEFVVFQKAAKMPLLRQILVQSPKIMNPQKRFSASMITSNLFLSGK